MVDASISLIQWVNPRLRAIQELAAIREEIEAEVQRLAEATPALQRCMMTAWIARARAIQEEMGDPAWLRDGVARIARVLQGLSRVWWPGNVHALSRRARPRQVLARTGTEPATWSDVAVWSRALAREAPTWADEAALEPRPFHPGERFAALVDELDGLGGPLGTAPVITDASAVVERARGHLDDLRRIAGELRWLRGAVDAIAWGAAIGRLRGLARHLHDPELDRRLDPSFAPPEGWAGALDEDPIRARLVATLPGEDAGDAELAEWLAAALESPLEIAAIRALAGSLLSRIAGLALELSSRRLRRRLDKVRSAVGVGDDGDATMDATFEDEHGRSDQDPVPCESEVRALVEGKRAVFVTNRESPEVAEALASRLGLRCDVIVNKVRQQQSLCGRVRRGHYDVVMIAHGFSSHGDTGRLRRACRHSHTPYVAVDKGRPSKIIQMLFESRHLLGAARRDH